jgi:hypothetical protein
MAKAIFDLHPMSIGDILDRTIRLYRRAFLHNVAIVAVPYIVLIPLALLAGPAFVSGRDPRLFLQPRFLGPGILFGLLYIWLTFLSMGALARSVSDQFLRETPTVAGSYRVVIRRSHSLVWAYFLAFLVYGGLAIAMAFSIGLTMAFNPLLGVAVAIALAVLAAVAFLRLFLVTHVIVLEEARGVVALRRSWDLMRGNFWRAVLILIFSFVVAIVLSLLLGFPGKLLGGMIGGGAGLALVQVFDKLSTVLLTPLYAIAFTLLYYDSRIRSEAFDLAMMAQSLGGDTREPAGSVGATEPLPVLDAPAEEPAAVRRASPPPKPTAAPRPAGAPVRAFGSSKICPKCRTQFPPIRPTCPQCGTRVALRPAP